MANEHIKLIFPHYEVKNIRIIEIIFHKKKTDRKIKRLKRSCVVNGRKQALL